MFKKMLLGLLTAGLLTASAAPLPNSLTDSEREFIKNNYQKYLTSKYSSVRDSRIPKNISYAPAEFEPAEAVCYAWEGYTSLLKDLIKFSAEDGKVYVAVDSTYYADSAKKTLQAAGVKMENVEFIPCRIDSVWMRDYGPWWVYTQDGNREIIDFQYNRPRPNDDKFPEYLSKFMKLPNNKCPLILAGGNFIVDGRGTAFLTEVVWDSSEGGDSNLTVDQLNKYLKDYMGVTKVVVLKKMNEDGTGHIDMYCKLLNKDTFIVGEYKNPGDGAQGNYEILNENAQKLANETDATGNKYKVVRIPMPDVHDGGWGVTSFSYTNSLIFNKKVLVPIYGKDMDEEALNVYRTVLPEHNVKGFDCNDIITANGAIHCITKLVMKDPLQLSAAEPKNAKAGEDVMLTLSVESTKGINPSSAKVFWSLKNEGPFQEIAMTEKDGSFTAGIPSQASGATVYYYFEAEDVTGMYETLPEGMPEAEKFVLKIN